MNGGDQDDSKSYGNVHPDDVRKNENTAFKGAFVDFHANEEAKIYSRDYCPFSLSFSFKFNYRFFWGLGVHVRTTSHSALL